MGKDDKGHRVMIIVAIIGSVGVLGAAMIGVIPILRCPAPPEGKVGKDDVPMVLIPAGFYGGLQHDAFYMDKYEVTNAAYKKFMDEDEMDHEAPAFWDDPDFNDPGHPVVGVSWHDAVAYCEWAGERLPTEAEWEYAARGGLVGKEYPWDSGDTYGKANFVLTFLVTKRRTAPVGSFDPNGYGLYDMAGNVGEWCQDWFDSAETTRVLRGGGWRSRQEHIRVAYRYYGNPTVKPDDVGFRCRSQDSDVTP